MKEPENNSRLPRRTFLKLTGAASIGVALGAIWVDDGVAAIPASGGYILVDTKKCAGCMTCMLACSLVHEGQNNLSLARIQVLQNPYGKFPGDIMLSQCRQCVEAACVEICPVEAMHIDTEHGNVRRVDTEKCIGCGQCVEACPFTPARATMNPENGKSVKCDLCIDTPYWEEKGGPDGRRACEELCPMRAIKFSRKIPKKNGAGSYEINLRGPAWEHIGFPKS
jgi:protein NrfC